MSAKRPSLFGAAIPAPPDPAPEPEAKPAAHRPPSREGKRALTVYLRPEAWKQLRMLSVQIESSTQALGEDAINLLFEKHRLNRIA
jgi:antitoxin-like ribbon-helix-helix protein